MTFLFKSTTYKIFLGNILESVKANVKAASVVQKTHKMTFLFKSMTYKIFPGNILESTSLLEAIK